MFTRTKKTEMDLIVLEHFLIESEKNQNHQSRLFYTLAITDKKIDLSILNLVK